MTGNEHNPMRGRLWAQEAPTTSDLLELALFDAIGILDEDERRAFDEAFERAPAALQRQIRESQGRFLATDGLFPDIEPSALLRDRAIKGVHDAIASDRATAGRAGQARTVAHAQGRSAPRIRQSRRVNSMWRAASISLAVAVVSLGAVMFRLQQDYNTLGTQAGLSQLIDTIGVSRLKETLIDTTSERIAFVPTAAAESGSVTLWLAEGTGDAWIYTHKLPGRDGASYMVVELDEQDQVVSEIKQFPNDALYASVPLEIALNRGSRLGIVRIGEGGSDDVLMFTADIPLA